MNYQRSSAVQAAKVLVLHAPRRRQLAACNTLARSQSRKKGSYFKRIGGSQLLRLRARLTIVQLIRVAIHFAPQEPYKSLTGFL